MEGVEACTGEANAGLRAPNHNSSHKHRKCPCCTLKTHRKLEDGWLHLTAASSNQNRSYNRWSTPMDIDGCRIVAPVAIDSSSIHQGCSHRSCRTAPYCYRVDSHYCSRLALASRNNRVLPCRNHAYKHLPSCSKANLTNR